MLSMQQRSKMSNVIGGNFPPQAATEQIPPIGPVPLFLSRKEVDTLYDSLQVVQRILIDLEMEYIPIKSTLLGAVRSKSILFNENDGIAIGIFDDDSASFARFGRQQLSQALLNDEESLQEATPQQSNDEHLAQHERIIRYQERSPDGSCDRITFSSSSRIGIDLHVLCKYETRQDLLDKIDYDGNDTALRRTLDCIPESAFPLYHYDNAVAVKLKPLQYLTVAEVRPLSSTAFGALELPCPNDCMTPLERFYGSDWSTHYNTYDATNNDSSQQRLLEEEHYLPTQHSYRRIWSNHSKKVLEQRMELYREDQEEVAEEEPVATTSGGMARSRSLFALGNNNNLRSATSPLSVTRLEEPLRRQQVIHKPTKWFGADVRRHVGEGPDAPIFDKDLRAVMEPHLRKARLKREECRTANDAHPSISSSVGVPYTALRDERRFLFDPHHSHPLHQILADTLGVDDLSQLHKHTAKDKRELLSPLLTTEGRLKFQESYDTFVTSFCIPLLHSLAMTKQEFHGSSTSNAGITYRYQAFPCIRVVRPGEFSIGPHCDTAYGHSIGNLNFHIPLTAVSGTNALFIESFPGKEDWHALTTKSPGLGFLFDGARCLHFTMENTTDVTRVSIDFRIAIYNAKDDDALCSKELRDDRFSQEPGYYDEAFVALDGGGALVAKKRTTGKLLVPDRRVGYPFK